MSEHTPSESSTTSAHDPAAYGTAWAAVYDEWHSEPPDQVTDFIGREVKAVGGGPTLELAAGTGRLALPLAESGHEVWALDASSAMLDQLRSKTGADDLHVIEADMADFALERTDFAVVFVAVNSLFLLLTQELQVSCFASAARHLRPGGRFVVECFVPDLSRFTENTNLSTREVGDGVLRLDASVHDPIAQVVRSQVVCLRPGAMELLPVTIRYSLPAELDLMARLAGLSLHARFSSWLHSPFDRWSRSHVSVYERG